MKFQINGAVPCLILHGCGTWFLIVMDDYRVRVTENRVLIRTFGHEREGVTGKQRNVRCRASQFEFLTKHFQGDEINETVMVTRCSSSQREDKPMQNLGTKT